MQQEHSEEKQAGFKGLEPGPAQMVSEKGSEKETGQT